jgi:hypothetical protein
MAEVTSRVRVGSEVVNLTFEPEAGGLDLITVASRLRQVDDVMTNFQKLAGWPTFEGPALPEIAHFVVLRIRLESPLELLLAAVSAPKHLTEAVISYFKSIVFLEETRNRMAAEGARAWEGVFAERLKNIEHAIQIAKSLNPDKTVDKEILNTLLSTHDSLQYGQLRLTKVKVENN